MGAPAAGPGSQRPAGTGFLVLVLLLGLVWMHALAAGQHAAAASHGAEAVACGTHEPTAPCPAEGSGHPGPMCQAGSVPSGPAVAPPPLATSPVPEPTPVVATSPATAAGDAGGGTGCGPPSLAMLSISRT